MNIFTRSYKNDIINSQNRPKTRFGYFGQLAAAKETMGLTDNDQQHQRY